MSAMDLMFADPEDLEHIKRLDAALFNNYDLSDVVNYLEEKTFLKGDRFSFKDHEFQCDILSDTSDVINVQKCAQVGMSEAMARYALAVARIMPYFSVIMTMPHAGDASNFAKTRLDPIINETPDLRDVMDKELDNSEVKGIGNSLLYMRGCSGTTAALSVPADMLIHDEVDRSDPDILGQYQSRIKHSKYKKTRHFGTPTLDGRGIALHMESSRRYRQACVCNHCQHTFVPSFHTDVVIPGYKDDENKGELKNITKYNLNNIRWQEAYLACPACKQEPSLQREHRKWICENPSAIFEAKGYYVTPFEVPNVVTIASLVKEITKYKSWIEFVNQALGETANSSESQLTAADVNNAKVTDYDLRSNEMHCMGIDVGQICHIAVGRETPDGELLVVHRERVVLAKLKARKAELKRQFRVAVTVIDSQPETHLVHLMQKADKNLYGAVYSQNRKLATYEIVLVEKDLKEGKLPIHQARIIRDLNFDEVMALFKAGLIKWMPQDSENDELFINHCTDMTRTQVLDRSNETVYTWAKSKEGQDHYMHTVGYLHVACRLKPTLARNVNFSGAPLAMIMKMTKNVSVVRGAMR